MLISAFRPLLNRLRRKRKSVLIGTGFREGTGLAGVNREQRFGTADAELAGFDPGLEMRGHMTQQRHLAYHQKQAENQDSIPCKAPHVAIL